MIKQVAHDAPAADGPSGLGLALAVAAELHPPVTRAPEVAPAATRAMAPRRKSTATAARTHRRTTVG
ncbi:hypothetical protein [Streptomyces neyagawaensis]|uniref:hypothetical protein n=1 Tax=Streptomyces neyagawaensis TaxID=42238 RepID=UPI0006E24754|nr:hypothetical protein [Streptomyces neyagawaensis]MCL6736965.1 hypothetical protein [Streptomyces neyagawaensis]MDE1687301.1 hypothetical protein [Streptomyces neyagawaensis]